MKWKQRAPGLRLVGGTVLYKVARPSSPFDLVQDTLTSGPGALCLALLKLRPTLNRSWYWEPGEWGIKTGDSELQTGHRTQENINGNWDCNVGISRNH